MVHKLEKGDLSLRALGHDATSNGDFIFGVLPVFEMSVLLVELLDRVRAYECMTIRIATRVDERLTLVATNLYGVVDDLLLCIGHD